jgi:hypothetical protein
VLRAHRIKYVIPDFSAAAIDTNNEIMGAAFAMVSKMLPFAQFFAEFCQLA